MRLPAVTDSPVHNLPRILLRSDDQAGAQILAGPVKHASLLNKEPEGPVLLSSDAEDDGFLCFSAAKFRGRSDFAVRVDADTGAGILPGKARRRHAAVPEGNRALLFIDRHRIPEEGGAVGHLLSCVHGKCAVDVRLTAADDLFRIQEGEHRANGRAEIREEIGPAARCQRADLMLLYIGPVGSVESGKIKHVLLGHGLQALQLLPGLLQLLPDLFLRIGLCGPDQLSGFDGYKPHAEGSHQLLIQRAAEAEALRGMSDCQKAQRAHLLQRPRCQSG